MKIEQEIIKKVAALPILDVLGNDLDLKKRGSNYVARCPLHGEKTASFTISPSRNSYKCFGCGSGGDAIKFYMERDRVSFVEAVTGICNRFGIEIVRSEEQSRIDRAEQQIFEMNGIAAEYMRSCYPESLSERNMVARGIAEEMATAFQIGHAKALPSDLYKHMRAKGFTDDQLHGSGLIRKDDTRGWADSFRDRTVFPIHNVNGKIVGFSARRNSETQNPKYINTPETIVFKKSKELYGLYQAKSEIIKMDMAYVVEGQTDVIAMHRSGIGNTVASLGTAFTSEHAMSLRRFTMNLCLLYDGDAAGLKAVFKGCEVLFSHGFNVSICQLPEGEDPDSYIRAHGGDAMRAHIKEKSAEFIDFRLSMLTGAIQDKVRIGKECKRMISLHPDETTRQIMLAEYNKKFGLEYKPASRPAGKSEPMEEDNPVDFHVLRVMLLYWDTVDFPAWFGDDVELCAEYGITDEHRRKLFRHLMANPNTTITEVLHGDDAEISETANAIIDSRFKLDESNPDYGIRISLTEFDLRILDSMEQKYKHGEYTPDNQRILRGIRKMRDEKNKELNHIINNKEIQVS